MRKLEGVPYWVIDDADEIYDFISTNVRREWEADSRDSGRDPKRDPWLQTLSRRRWKLQTVEVDKISLDPTIMNYVDVKRGYSFRDSLARRRKELRSVIETYAVVIWPVIVRNEDMTLVDGYCRLTALGEMGISKVYTYVGTLSPNR